MGLFTKLFGGADGCREAMRESYGQHVKAARANGMEAPHVVGLFGALGSRWKSRGHPVSEGQLWLELSPFLAMSESEAVEAVAEYAVFQERPGDARQDWLKRKINNALLAPNDASFAAMAAGGILNRATWCELLEPATLDAIRAAASNERRNNSKECQSPRDERLTKPEATRCCYYGCGNFGTSSYKGVSYCDEHYEVMRKQRFDFARSIRTEPKQHEDGITPSVTSDAASKKEQDSPTQPPTVPVQTQLPTLEIVRDAMTAHPPPSPSSDYEVRDAQQDATARIGAASALAEAEPAGHLSAPGSGQDRGIPQPRRLKSPTAFPNLLFGAIFLVTLITEFSHNYNPWDALGYALGVCLIPLALGLAWNATKGEARTLKWMYVGASSLFVLIFEAAQVQDAKDATSQATPSTVTPYAAPPALETPVTAGPLVGSTQPPRTEPNATASPASSSMAAPSTSSTEVPQLNTRRQRRPPAITPEDVRPAESIERPQSPPTVPEKLAYSYRNFSSMVALGTPDEVRDALDRGASVNDRSGGTVPLIVAARHGRTEIVGLLLSRGAEVDAKDTNGHTAMYYAKTNADANTIELLRQWGAGNPFGH